MRSEMVATVIVAARFGLIGSQFYRSESSTEKSWERAVAPCTPRRHRRIVAS